MRYVQSDERKATEVKKLNKYIQKIYYLKDIEKDVYNIGKMLTVKTEAMANVWSMLVKRWFIVKQIIKIGNEILHLVDT